MVGGHAWQKSTSRRRTVRYRSIPRAAHSRRAWSTPLGCRSAPKKHSRRLAELDSKSGWDPGDSPLPRRFYYRCAPRLLTVPGVPGHSPPSLGVLGVPLSVRKEKGPTTCIIYLGIEADTRRATAASLLGEWGFQVQWGPQAQPLSIPWANHLTDNLSRNMAYSFLSRRFQAYLRTPIVLLCLLPG